jgi:hypothetical protein
MATENNISYSHDLLVQLIAQDLERVGIELPALAGFAAEKCVKGDAIAFSHGTVWVENGEYAKQHQRWQQRLSKRPDLQEGEPSRKIRVYEGKNALDMRIRIYPIRKTSKLPSIGRVQLSKQFTQGGMLYLDGQGHELLVDDREIAGPGAEEVRKRVDTILEHRINDYFLQTATPGSSH